MRAMVKAKAVIKFNLRMPKALREELLKAAVEGNRSLNQEIVYRLANTLEFDRQFLKSAVMQDAILDALAKGRRPRVKRK
jgi:Arc-like DNA binding domain